MCMCVHFCMYAYKVKVRSEVLVLLRFFFFNVFAVYLKFSLNLTKNNKPLYPIKKTYIKMLTLLLLTLLTLNLTLKLESYLLSFVSRIHFYWHNKINLKMHT